jgi:hypothetical protein
MYGIRDLSSDSTRSASRKDVKKVISLLLGILIPSIASAVVPLIPFFEDYFIQGMYYGYGNNYNLFIGFPTKERHITVLQAYYNKTSVETNLTWREISDKVDGMFSKQYGIPSRRPVHFYGNDGVCLFKYFVRSNDARRSRMPVDSGSQITDKKGDIMVWLMLIVNFVCFIIIAHCYLAIYIENKNSASRSGQNDDPNRRREDKALQAKIAIIILTDFICWIPFIIICAFHNTGWIDATLWYVNLALIVLPVNSVINPLIADDTLQEYITKCFDLSVNNLTFLDFFSENDISRTRSSNARESVELTLQ